MYGIVNVAVQEMVLEHHDEATWQQIVDATNMEIPFFLSDHSYDDAITYALVGAAAKVLKTDASDILKAFGKHWVLKTSMHKYGDLMKSGGYNLSDFLTNLPNFHSRVMLLYPNLQPPEFTVQNLQNKEYCLNYYSHREGLSDFVYGLLLGLSELFNEPIEIKRIENTSTDSTALSFYIQLL